MENLIWLNVSSAKFCTIYLSNREKCWQVFNYSGNSFFSSYLMLDWKARRDGQREGSLPAGEETCGGGVPQEGR
jgi:hypothetical protein